MAKVLRGDDPPWAVRGQLSACIAARPRDGVPTQLISAAEVRGYSDDIRVWGDSYASYPAHRLVAFRNERLNAARTDPSIKLNELNARTLSGGGSSGASTTRNRGTHTFASKQILGVSTRRVSDAGELHSPPDFL
ncbi:hypothetical protein [Sinorhizobium mexicanum]|uniref:Uncharacterized protein n=1 Tax=Sinorhizobium mexicanum TaxID=375549 RepID=A0A859QYX2_9HYPH|nr:hypothetical protein [Sinorhizobium mexicanum]QLL64061.1 hypothetical protein FKV68_21630 [Sinorhizobium mexicanum]